MEHAAQGVMLCERPGPSHLERTSLKPGFVPSSATAQLEQLGLCPTHKVFPATASPKPPSITLRAKADVASIQQAGRAAEELEAQARAEAAMQRANLAAFTSTLRSHILDGKDVSGYWKPVQQQFTVQNTLNTPLPELHATRQHLLAESPLEAADSRRDNLGTGVAPVSELQSSMEGFVNGLLEEAKTKLSNTQMQQAQEHTSRAVVSNLPTSETGAPGNGAGLETGQGEQAASISTGEKAAASSPENARQGQTSTSGAVAASRPASSGNASRPPAKGRKGKSNRPAWALSETQLEDLETLEEEELLNFADNLDFDSFVHQMDDAELHETFNELQAAESSPVPDEAAWRASFVRAMNHAAMKRVAEARASKLERMARGEGSECDAASVAPSDAKSRASAVKERLDAFTAARSAAAADWDASTTNDARAAKLERVGRAREAAEVLRENPELRSVHSPASVLAVLSRVEATAAQ